MDHPPTTPSVHCVTPKATPGRKYNFKCPCTISFCQNDGNEIRAFLETAGCCELLAPKTVAYVPNPSSHQQRKQYAFRKSVEHHLKIPREVREQNKKYQVFSYHWPTPLLKLKLRNASLLNDVQVKLITEEQQSLYGITSNALREFVNTYEHNVLPFIVSLQLSALEQVDLKCYVQAPVATRDEIMAYATSFVSQRSARSTSREFNKLSQVDDEYATSFVSQRSARSTSREFNKLSQVDDELSQVDDELPPVDDEPSPPDDRASPLLAPTQQQLLSGLIGKFERYQASQRSVDEFLGNDDVRASCKILSLVYSVEGPICLSNNSGQEDHSSYWLLLCKCGNAASIGLRNNHVWMCNKCRCVAKRRQKQIQNVARLSDPSCKAPFSSLITPVKAKLKENLQQQLRSEKRRSRQLQSALKILKDSQDSYFSPDDDAATDLIGKAVRHVAEDQQSVIDLIKGIVTKISGSSKEQPAPMLKLLNLPSTLLPRFAIFPIF